jgi:predicted RNase H-like HicB family nuclease
MASASGKLRLSYVLDPEPVNGWVLSRCEALDLVSQGRTPEEARDTLREEASLLLAQAQASGALAPLLERAALHKVAGGDAFEIDLGRLS